jgi:2-keto-4-pentenoate hydratase/2-oxohepta-3-ene-1,7-dioic acid hydratase in catechol pathway
LIFWLLQVANNIKRRAMSLQLGDIISSGNQPGSRLSYLPTVSMVEGQKMEKGIQGLSCQHQ